MKPDISVEVGGGWAGIVLNVIVIGSTFPESWNFRFHRAWRSCGRMRVHVTVDSDDFEAINATVALSEIAWEQSGVTCEVCGASAYLQLGQRYALMLCHQHDHLIGARHPDAERIGDPWSRHAGASLLSEGYGDPAAVRDELLKMWVDGRAKRWDVMQLLQLDRFELDQAADVGGYASDWGCILAAASDDGTRH